jgi:hypothetical protein
MKGGLGQAEVELAASFTAPLFWILRGERGETIKNGSVFFLDAGEGVFAVTASHVVEECFADSRSPSFVQCMIGGNGDTLPIHLRDRIIDANHDLDIATFRVTEEEVRATRHTVLTGYQKAWPPPSPQRDRGIVYCGYPGTGREVLAPREISFGCVASNGIATSVNEDSISVQIEREHLFPLLGEGMIPENYDFRGISGGPLIAIVQTSTIRSWMPAGVIIRGPNTSNNVEEAIPGFEVITARPIQFILPNGELDNDRWAMNNIHRVGRAI